MKYEYRKVIQFAKTKTVLHGGRLCYYDRQRLVGFHIVSNEIFVMHEKEGARMIAKKYLALICLGLFVVVSFGTSMALLLSRPVAQAPVEKEETPKEKAEPKKTQEAVRYVYDVGMTEETFRSRYNQVVAEMFSEYPIQLQQVQPYTFQHTITYEDPFTDRLSMMVCRYQDTNLVKGVLISSHAANELDSVQFLSVIASTLTVMEPSFTPKERGEFLKKLGMFSDDGPTDYRDINRSIERNGKRYFIRGNNGDGVSGPRVDRSAASGWRH